MDTVQGVSPVNGFLSDGQSTEEGSSTVSGSADSPSPRIRWFTLYLGGLTTLAAALLGFLIYAQLTQSLAVTPGVFVWPALILLTATAMYAERYAIRFGRGMEVSAVFLPLFLAGAIVGPLGAFVAAVVSQVWFMRRSDWQRGLCFASALGIASGGSALFYWALINQFGTSEALVAGSGLLAGILFHVLSLLVFAPYYWLRHRVRLAALWREGFQPFLPFHLFFLLISPGLVFVYRNYVLTVPPDTSGLVFRSTLMIILCLLPVAALIYAFRAYAHKRELEHHLASVAVRNERLALESVASLVTALDVRDHNTRTHSAQVAKWAVDLAESLGLSEYEVSLTHVASLMHDVGKIVMVDEALKSSDESDPILRAMVEAHPRDGANILSKIGEFKELATVVLYHHERYDGKGYPVGLAGEEIPLISRIISVADGYSNMVSDRPYRPRLSPREAQAALSFNKGIQFDPAVVDAFLRLLHQRDEDYQEGQTTDFLLEFQKVKFLREAGTER